MTPHSDESYTMVLLQKLKYIPHGRTKKRGILKGTLQKVNWSFILLITQVVKLIFLNAKIIQVRMFLAQWKL